MRSPLPAPQARRLPYGVLVGVIVILYFAKEVLIPLALALLFSFLLGPVVRRLERLGLGRVPGVLTVAAGFFCLAALLGWMMVSQSIELAGKVPSYQGNIQHKLEALRGRGGSFQTAAHVLEKLQQNASEASPAEGHTEKANDKAADRTRDAAARPPPPPQPVRVVEPAATPLQFLRNFFGPLLGPLSLVGIVIIFTVFILIQREDLRDRLVHLAGPERLPITTQAIDEAGSRVSRYLRAQVTVNVGFGSVVAVGLYFIGVPNAALWGLLATVFRFVPYVGVVAAATAPLLISLAAFDTWRPLALTVGLFAALELTIANAVEPWLYGTSTGLSPVAVIVAATFWTWLWGGVGLLLSTPLTVCIVVLGRYVPQLEFLHTLLGDEPAVPVDAKLYQRLLAFDEEEFSSHVDEYLTAHPVAELYDQVLIPLLNQAQHDARTGSLGEDRQEFIRQTVRTLVEDLRERPPEALAPPPVAEGGTDQAGKAAAATVAAAKALAAPPPPAVDLPVRVMVLPVKTEADETAAIMLGHLLTLGRIGNEVLSAKALAQEAVEAVAARGPEVVCLSAVRPFAVMQARYLAKKLRTRCPDLNIMIGLWDPRRPSVGAHRNLANAPSDWIVDTLADALTRICPVVQCLPEPALGASPEEAELERKKAQNLVDSQP